MAKIQIILLITTLFSLNDEYELRYYLHISDCFDCIRSKIFSLYNNLVNYNNVKHKILVSGALLDEFEILQRNFYPIECKILLEKDTTEIPNKPTLVIYKNGMKMKNLFISELDKTSIFSLFNYEIIELNKNIVKIYRCDESYINKNKLFILDNTQSIIIEYNIDSGNQTGIIEIDKMIKYYYINEQDTLWNKIDKLKYHNTKIINFSYDKDNDVVFILYQVLSGYDIVDDENLKDNKKCYLNKSYILGSYKNRKLKNIFEMDFNNHFILPGSNLYYENNLLYSALNQQTSTLTDTTYIIFVYNIYSNSLYTIKLPIQRKELIQIGAFKHYNNILTYYNPFANFFAFLELGNNKIIYKNLLNINEISQNKLLPFIRKVQGFIDNYLIYANNIVIAININDSLKGQYPELWFINLNDFSINYFKFDDKTLDNIHYIHLIDIIENECYFIIRTKENKWYILKYKLEA